MADNSLTLPAAKSTQVPQADRVVVGDEERGPTGGTLLSIGSWLLNTCSGLASIDLTQEMPDEESRENLRDKMNDSKVG